MLKKSLRAIKRFLKNLLLLQDYDIEARKEIARYLCIREKTGRLNSLWARHMYNRLRIRYLVTIPLTTKVGKDLYIAHAHNVHIGKHAIIGDNCKIYPNASIIAAVKGDEERNARAERRHATIGNDCILGAGSMIIGPIIIGDNVTIAAGAIVTKNVPSHSLVKGVNQIREKRNDEIPEKYKSNKESY